MVGPTRQPAAYGVVVPIPMGVARFNRRVTNRVAAPLLRRLPGFAVVHHVGRRSGRAYRTPVNLFPDDGGYVIALPYGPGTDWLKNVLAAGGCELEVRGRRVRCTSPVVSARAPVFASSHGATGVSPEISARARRPP